MADSLVDFTAAPKDALERLIWLSGVTDQVRTELDAQYAQAYFEARLTNRLDAALDLRLHSRKRVIAYSRRHNEAIGRTIRWNDGRS